MGRDLEIRDLKRRALYPQAAYHGMVLTSFRGRKMVALNSAA
ncbi:hypothetical protein B2J93_6764 [Marssonina coronariae]|uniref:Uncharacterized protein n=1 Tax=Diplocarpon coronariae TaxID=2795749 RepID=A0A218Z7B1_9HELO|nr:hypothetical protein B2J93_6764 [Marssonina coronariae]